MQQVVVNYAAFLIDDSVVLEHRVDLWGATNNDLTLRPFGDGVVRERRRPHGVNRDTKPTTVEYGVSFVQSARCTGNVDAVHKGSGDFAFLDDRRRGLHDLNATKLPVTCFLDGSTNVGTSLYVGIHFFSVARGMPYVVEAEDKELASAAFTATCFSR